MIFNYEIYYYDIGVKFIFKLSFDILNLLSYERIASFLPSATEVLYEIGAGDQIVCVTHECKFPEEAKRKPKVINSSFDPARINSKEIDDKIVELIQSGRDIYIIDDKTLKEAKPDLIVAQAVCEVCSPFTKEINRAISILDYKPEILILDPHDLDDILISIMDVAEKVGRIKEGRKLVASLQNRIDSIRIRHKENKPKVLCIEWIDPFFTAGHWIPQMVEIAGGINGLGSYGQPSSRMDMDEIIKFDPDKIILMPCGFDIDRTLIEFKQSKTSNELKSLRAVQNNEIFAVDAGAYFSKPSPRTITGLEILAKIIHPDKFTDQIVPINSFIKIK
jgi:iron complex transport system substrate-binding protein